MDLEQMHRAAGDRVRFVVVYVREAHALDEWVTPDNVQDRISVMQPGTDLARGVAAGRLCARLDLTMPTVTDGLDDSVSDVYGAWPDRMYVLDEEGVVVHKTAVGPFGFRPADVRDVLVSRWGLDLPPTTYEPPSLRR